MPLDMKFAHFFLKIDQLRAVTYLSYPTEYEIVIYEFTGDMTHWFECRLWIAQTKFLTSVSQVSSTEFRIQPCLPWRDRNRFSLPHFLSTKLPLSVSFLIQLFHMYQCTFEACVARFYSSYYRLMTPIVWKSSFLSVENRLSLWIQSVCFLSPERFLDNIQL